ncbi:UvrABC system protein C [Clarias magur]|uniref:UvrABC system protein C n=1 Tax=Clarias magur TaxID=1594786 RepID=A0A8J4TLL0_CLAMG|nr:UvrABC system protein C [Clarias magur]
MDVKQHEVSMSYPYSVLSSPRGPFTLLGAAGPVALTDQKPEPRHGHEDGAELRAQIKHLHLCEGFQQPSCAASLGSGVPRRSLVYGLTLLSNVYSLSVNDSRNSRASRVSNLQPRACGRGRWLVSPLLRLVRLRSRHQYHKAPQHWPHGGAPTALSTAHVLPEFGLRDVICFCRA